MNRSIYILIALAGIVWADSTTVFDTQFAALPDGWSNSNWGFSWQYGAWVDEWVTSAEPPYNFTATMSSQAGTESWYFVPDGTDSLQIHIEHDFDAMVSASSEAYILMLSPSTSNEYLFHEEISNAYSTSDPVDITFTAPPAGAYIGFKVYAYVGTSYPAYSTIEWNIYDLTVTAYGNGMALEPITWGELKQLP